MTVREAAMIAFDRGALQHRGEPLLAGIVAHGVVDAPFELFIPLASLS